MSGAGPLTRVDAIVAAVLIENRQPHMPGWDGITARLLEWAYQQPQTEHEEGEMPSQTQIPEADGCTIRADKRPRGAVNTPRATDNYEGVAAR